MLAGPASHEKMSLPSLPFPTAHSSFPFPRMSRPSVALLIETSNAYARGLLRGIRGYLREHGPWSIYLGEQRRGEPAADWLRRWQGDGIIARIENEAIAKAVLKLRVPVVNVSAARHLPSFPYLETDDVEIARLVTGHLLERGFRNLAYFGDEQFKWSSLRREHFDANWPRPAWFAMPTRRVGGPSVPAVGTRRSSTSAAGWKACRNRSALWRLTIFAAGSCSTSVANAASPCRIRWPSSVWIMTNWSAIWPALRCRAWHRTPTPPVMRPRLLETMMAGRSVPAGGRLIKPLGIVTRGSTDVLALEDAEISQAIRFIREHASDGIKVKDVLAAVPLSRRVLKHPVPQTFGRTPHDEIVRVQIERARQLLAETELTQTAVADRCGYRHVEYLTVAFKRATGEIPSQYRARIKDR